MVERFLDSDDMVMVWTDNQEWNDATIEKGYRNPTGFRRWAVHHQFHTRVFSGVMKELNDTTEYMKARGYTV